MTVVAAVKVRAADNKLACHAYRGKSVAPIKNRSIDWAHNRPSRIAQTTSDWPRRMSPAEKTFGSEV
jgi:hypothetical protein